MLFGCHSLAVPVGRKRMDVGDEGPPVGFRAASATAIWSATMETSYLKEGRNRLPRCPSDHIKVPANVSR